MVTDAAANGRTGRFKVTRGGPGEACSPVFLENRDENHTGAPKKARGGARGAAEGGCFHSFSCDAQTEPVTRRGFQSSGKSPVSEMVVG